MKAPNRATPADWTLVLIITITTSLALLLGCVGCKRQKAPSASAVPPVSFRVVSQKSHAPISGATVTSVPIVDRKPRQSHVAGSCTTAADGTCSQDLAPGAYQVVAAKKGKSSQPRQLDLAKVRKVEINTTLE